MLPDAPSNGTSLYPRQGSVTGLIDTGETLLAAGDLSGHDVAKSILDYVKAHGGGGPPEVHRKKQRHSNLLWLLAVLVVGPGGMYVTQQILKASTANNAAVNAEQRIQINEHDAAIKANTNSVVQIKYKIDQVATQQTKISAGIEELKAESVDVLKEELREAKKELHRR